MTCRMGWVGGAKYPYKVGLPLVISQAWKVVGNLANVVSHFHIILIFIVFYLLEINHLLICIYSFVHERWLKSSNKIV